MAVTFINYLILQIAKGNLSYSEVVKRFPKLKTEIKKCLIESNREDLIDEKKTKRKK